MNKTGLTAGFLGHSAQYTDIHDIRFCLTFDALRDKLYRRSEISERIPGADPGKEQLWIVIVLVLNDKLTLR